ncbi:hypothetical protein APG07_23970 [Pseudomonas aeruginosa]|nr:hypothetical protein Y905_26205 [Pseudomonas aeruginosa C2159M]KEI30133.1 hypothetical protein CH80_05475 [Pseudomonas aeruginosa]KKJ45017.1 hypothetical protein T649_23855 [Pseudomonas aeruginosa MRSN 321]KQC56030.1 hypothetical protein APG03_24980 [Pseudomonas aeruginosa]KQC68678.1 hypothetical protein APG07_23970 [Pseudomonas aeruginosa]
MSIFHFLPVRLCLCLQAGFQCAASGLLFFQLDEHRCGGRFTFAAIVAVLGGQLTVILHRLIGELSAAGVFLPFPDEPRSATDADQQRCQNNKSRAPETHCSTSSARA